LKIDEGYPDIKHVPALKRRRSRAVLDESAGANDQVDDRQDYQRRADSGQGRADNSVQEDQSGWVGPLSAESRAPPLGRLDMFCGELAVVGHERDPRRGQQDREAEGERSRCHVR
jgi:hypothetical protein